MRPVSCRQSPQASARARSAELSVPGAQHLALLLHYGLSRTTSKKVTASQASIGQHVGRSAWTLFFSSTSQGNTAVPKNGYKIGIGTSTAAVRLDRNGGENVSKKVCSESP